MLSESLSTEAAARIKLLEDNMEIVTATTVLAVLFLYIVSFLIPKNKKKKCCTEKGGGRYARER